MWECGWGVGGRRGLKGAVGHCLHAELSCHGGLVHPDLAGPILPWKPRVVMTCPLKTGDLEAPGCRSYGRPDTIPFRQ